MAHLPELFYFWLVDQLILPSATVGAPLPLCQMTTRSKELLTFPNWLIRLSRIVFSRSIELTAFWETNWAISRPVRPVLQTAALIVTLSVSSLSQWNIKETSSASEGFLQPHLTVLAEVNPFGANDFTHFRWVGAFLISLSNCS